VPCFSFLVKGQGAILSLELPLFWTGRLVAE
jgi:hypothetical protein